MKYLLLLLILLPLLAATIIANADDYLFGEIGVYKNLGTNDWEGNHPIRFTGGYEWAGENAYVRLEASHISNLDKGPPFNGYRESWLDYAGIAVGWRFKLR